jgi:hypothetical protein
VGSVGGFFIVRKVPYFMYFIGIDVSKAKSGRAVSRSKPPSQADQVLLGEITVLRLRLLVDCQGESTLQFC